jgi:hypothetical protein
MHVLAVLDPSDWPKQDSQGHRGSLFYPAFFAFGTAKFQSCVPDDQILQPHVQLTRLAHHPGSLA